MSRPFDLIEGALTTFRAMSGYGAPGERNAVPVFDGVAVTNDYPRLWVVVGARMPWADEDADEVAATVESEFRSVPVDLGSRIESVSVPCAVGAYTGGDLDWRSLRRSIDGVLADVDEQLRSNQALGMSNVVSLVMESATYRQVAGTDGAVAVYEFDLAARFMSGGGRFSSTYTETF
jgi:hypothetical protein